MIKLANRNVKNAEGSATGSDSDTSFSFGTGTVLTTRRAFPAKTYEKYYKSGGKTRIDQITTNFSNGDYCIDHRTGTIYGLKATTGTADTGTYLVESTISGGGGGISSEVDVTKIAGTAISAKDAAYAEAPLGVGLEFETIGSLTTDGDTAGDKVPAKGTAEGVQYVVLVNPNGKASPQDNSNNTVRIENTTPDWGQEGGSTIADVTNDTDGTTNYYIENDGYSINGFHLILDNGSGTVTVTFEASMQDDGTAAASAAYVDVTADVFGSASFTGASSPHYLCDNDRKLSSAKFIKIKVVTSTGGSNDADFTIYHKRLYV